ncbi:MAG TPA: dihydrolipoamide acetyltransferase family protein [Anaerolineaceae bacterium]|nr:dihydrolipoamide acetyltransferase family protein [Anaerolineaceae bacterium]
MATTIVMPRFGATMEEGIVSFWAVKEGDFVTKGDVLGEIEIEKLSNELVAEEDGMILKIFAEEGVAIPCGQPILMIGQPDEVVELQVSQNEITNNQINPVEDPIKAVVPIDSKIESRSSKVTPKAQGLAEELGVDPSNLVGTGRLGMITREDVKAAFDSKAIVEKTIATDDKKQTDSKRNMTSMQTAISKAMQDSLRTSAQTTITFDLDASNLVAYHERLKNAAGAGEKHPTYTAIFIRIVAQALEQHPMLRSIIQNNQVITKSAINIGVAVDIKDGLVVPNIKNADKKSISQINNELEELTQKVKKHALTNEDITAGVFTITNLGTYGVKYFTPIINPGENAILGIGVLQETAVIVNGGIFLKPIFPLSLTHDHRAVNGAPAARFLQTIQEMANAL